MRSEGFLKDTHNLFRAVAIGAILYLCLAEFSRFRD
jgi:hypothetical protein